MIWENELLKKKTLGLTYKKHNFAQADIPFVYDTKHIYCGYLTGREEIVCVDLAKTSGIPPGSCSIAWLNKNRNSLKSYKSQQWLCTIKDYGQRDYCRAGSSF